MFKKLRENACLTQAEIEKKFNLPYSTVSKWEHRITQPRIKMLPELAKLLGVSIEEVVLCFINKQK